MQPKEENGDTSSIEEAETEHCNLSPTLLVYMNQLCWESLRYI